MATQASNCVLSRHTEYPLNSVELDKATHEYGVQLSSPPPTCPGGFFAHRSAEVRVDENTAVSKLVFPNGQPVILVPNNHTVRLIDSAPASNFPFGTVFIILLLAVVGWVAWKKGLFATLIANFKGGNGGGSSTPTPPSGGGNKSSTNDQTTAVGDGIRNPLPSKESLPPAPPPPPPAPNSYRRGGSQARAQAQDEVSNAAPGTVTHTTVIQSAPAYVPGYAYGGGSGLLTGVLVGEALAGGFDRHGGDTTVIHDREVVHEGGYSRNDDRGGNDDYDSRRSSSSADDNISSDANDTIGSDADDRIASDSDDSITSDASDSISSDYGDSSSSDGGSDSISSDE